MKSTSRVIAVVLVLAVLCSSLALMGGCQKDGVPTTYPYVFVHGLNGFGEDATDLVSYWGATSGTEILPMMREAGYECYAPSVDPMGSAWDRACELYAQLTGTRVDYGEAHSKEYGHERYGTTYDKPLFADWGTVDEDDNLRKVNLIGHSFGGATIRLLAALLKDGSEAEREAAPDDCSALFAGGKEDWVFSLTCLAAPHNGVSILALAESLADSFAGKIFVGMIETIGQNWDAAKIFEALESSGMLSLIASFGIDLTGLAESLDGLSTNITGKTVTDTLHLLTTPDNAYYDLSIQGAEQLNQQTGTAANTYYFSYPVDGTEDSADGEKRVPTDDMWSVIRILARIIGSWTGTAGTTEIDKKWLANDGLVNTLSATAPFNETLEPIDEAMDWETAKPGKWYIMPVTRGDHGTQIGLNKDEAYLRAYYSEILSHIDALSEEISGAPRPLFSFGS